MRVSDYNWTKNLEPVKPEVLKKMRFILDGIKSGVLNHHQEDVCIVAPDSDKYPCGTAFCFWGWYNFFELQSKSQKVSFFKVNPYPTKLVKVVKLYPYSGLPKELWKYSHVDITKYEADLGLESMEFNALFSASNTKRDLEAFVSKFEKGYRIYDYK